ncbi:YheC/D-like protein [Melghirimyces profundicolus]|uniref:YheC/D-like protein n=1 Tax=Melghirimyces profundicolus TaxID=1242148 RepID=A0A2T6BW08_9BACL|nr:YheC/YheD family protein [Melghirimyces profundicolus]PTX60243.1 YheC/D-like protein [Melghirimyces profundicolus]
MAVQRYVSDKMKYHDLLVENPDLEPHVPETVWFSKKTLQQMIDHHVTLYLKPNSNHRGNGIYRVSAKDGTCMIQSSSNDQIEQVPHSMLYKTLVQRMDQPRKYIVQQGLNLATLNGNPYDIRILMHKPEDEWQISGWLARVGRKDRIVTNHIRGAKPFPLEKALNSHPSIKMPEALKELTDLCHKISEIFGTHFNLRIIGLDMAVDQQGHIWFIEMNSSPMFRKMFRELGKRKMYRRALKTHRYIKKKYG